MSPSLPPLPHSTPEDTSLDPVPARQSEADVRHWPLRIQLRKKRIQRGMWEADSWSVTGCISDRDEGENKALSVVEQPVDETCTDYLWDGLSLELFRDERPAYRFNLSAADPRLFVICTEEDGMMRPYVLTASQDVASSYMDGGEEDVYSVAMPEAIQCWIEGFIGRHGEPELESGKSKRRHHGKRDRSDQSPIPSASGTRGGHV